MLKEVIALLEEAMESDLGTLTGEETMNEIDLDSLAVISFLAMVDERLGVSLPPQKLADARTVKELVRAIQKEKG
jgi:acyl carrier protein